MVKDQLLDAFFVITISFAIFFSIMAIRKHSQLRKNTSKLRKARSKTYADRLRILTHNLANASSQVDEILSELTEITNAKEYSLQQLEANLKELQERERKLKEGIETMESVPVEAAERFADLMEAGEQRSAKRDYLLFGIGVVLTTTIAIIIEIARG